MRRSDGSFTQIPIHYPERTRGICRNLSHWTPFHDVARDIGHATVTSIRDIGHEAASAWHSIASPVGSWF